MSAIRSYAKLETRLSLTDMNRLHALTKALNRSKADIAREAIRWYLTNRDKLLDQQKEEGIALALKSMTDRICGMLARQGLQIGTLDELAWQTHVEAKIEERFVNAVNLVKQKMRKRLTEDERIISERMRNIVK